MHDGRAELTRRRLRAGGFHSSVGLIDDGLILGAGSVLVRMAEGTGAVRRLALDADRDRLIAMLSVARGEPVARAEVLHHVEAASRHWQHGDKALANLRLVFARLPCLADKAAAERLMLAEDVLDGGTSPDALMKALWPDVGPEPLGKYNPAQPRVPAGNGVESGRWEFGGTGSVADHGERQNRVRIASSDEPSAGDDPSHHEREPEGPARVHLFGSLTRLPGGIGVGPFAGRAVPAGPGSRPTLSKQIEVDANGREFGCHTCGSKDPGTSSGRFFCDHQPPTALIEPGTPQVLYPHCLQCNCSQGGYVKHYKSNQK